MATLIDQDLAPYVTAASSERPVEATDRWVVLVDRGAPVSAIAPGTMLAAGVRSPAIIVAAATLDLSVALTSAAFAEVADVSAVVLTDETGIAGVWPGPALARTQSQVQSRGFLGPVLPGPPTIPLISRSCGFTDQGTLCGTVCSFASKPYPMPSCRNDGGLGAHLFHW